MPAAWSVSSGPVVNFYNGSGESGEEISAETAHQGLSKLYKSEFGLLFLKPSCLGVDKRQPVSTAPVGEFHNDGGRPRRRSRRFLTQPQLAGIATAAR